MSNLSFFEDVAHARSTDPETSHIAAATVTNLTLTKERILAILRIRGAQTDEELIRWFRRYYGNETTEQSIRSRRSELVKAGIVSFSGEHGISSTGRPSRKWGVV